MKPFLISLCLCSIAAFAFGWWQHGELQRLRTQKAIAVKAAERTRMVADSPSTTAVPGKRAAAEIPAESPSLMRNLVGLLQREESLSAEGLEEHFRDRSASGLLPGAMGMELAAKFCVVAAALGRRDPAETLNQLLDKLARSHADHHQFAALVVWTDWVLRDRKAAARWLQQSRASDKESYVRAAQMYIGPTDPGIAAALTESAPDSEKEK